MDIETRAGVLNQRRRDPSAVPAAIIAGAGHSGVDPVPHLQAAMMQHEIAFLNGEMAEAKYHSAVMDHIAAALNLIAEAKA